MTRAHTISTRKQTSDWGQVKLEFVTLGINAQTLAAKHCVGYASLQLRRKRENWDEARTAFLKELTASSHEVVKEVAAKTAVARFRSSEDIRADTHRTANIIAKRVADAFIDPKTGKPIKGITPRNLKDYAEVLEKAYALEMGTAGHLIESDQINLNAKILHAGVSVEQFQQMNDADLDKVLELAAQTKLLGERE